jgi:porin
MAGPGVAQEQEIPVATEEPANAPTLVDTRFLLTGDWNGERSKLAEAGLTFDVQWTQSAQGVVSGGRDTGWEYGGSVDFLTVLDLGRMDLLPGGYVRLLVEGRYGQSVNGDAGTVLPVNTDLLFPLTSELDEDVLAITELSYTQFFSPQFAVALGKLQTLDGDPNEFASGRGRSQFMNFNLVSPSLVGLAIPYSTLGAGVVFMPNERITISSTLMNTTDSSTTTGFSDIGDGTTWVTEARIQYRLGELPGGQNVGFAYAFDNDFASLGRSGLIGEDFTIATEDDTWTLYWSLWQYLLMLDDPPEVIDPGSGRPDVRGFGLFARASVVDEDTNIVEWAGSIGFGGRGLIPGRDEDVFGIGFGYGQFNDDTPLSRLLIENDGYGLEVFYNAMLAPGVALTGDIQWIETASRSADTALVAGVRLNLRF